MRLVKSMSIRQQTSYVILKGKAYASVWISAGNWDRHQFLSNTDEITVVFDRADAERTRIMG